MKAEILVVEDDEKFAENVIGALKDEGYSTTHCANGLQALERLQRQAFALVFVDLELPGMNGLELIESELFGYKRGAFTGAYTDKPGRFQLADQGTLFLDEIGDMSSGAQAKILRALETGEIEAIGDTQARNVNVPIIAATNHDVEQAVQAGTLREDLYYRLNEISVHIPPLRERKEDIPDLVNHFLKQACQEHNRYIAAINDSALALLQQHDWPGNIRQLALLVNKLVIFCEEQEISAQYVADHLNVSSEMIKDVMNYHDRMQQYERQLLVAALEKCDWHIGNAAEMLGLERTNLHKKIKKHQLRRGKEKPAKQ